MGDDEVKRRILGRRAAFVAAAVAGSSVGACDACGEHASPGVCLKVHVVEDAAATPPVDAGEPAPLVCLVIRPPLDLDGGADARPHPCLGPILRKP